MAIETELKLRISPEHLAKLKRHALLKAHTLTRPVTRRLYNIYCDTPKLELHRSAMALRLRRSGQRWLQTLKGGGSVQAGLHRRNEWEIPVSGPALEFSAALPSEWDQYLPEKLRKKLQPVFVTDFSRASRMVSWQGAQIELCIDQGEVSTEQSSLPICELELELKSGQPQQLFELALALLEIVPFELEGVSKAEQGYRLLSGHAEQPVKAVVPHMASSVTLAEALEALIWSCVQHLQGNLRGAMSNLNAEYLHQMRVALRRLRVVLRIAEKICPDAQLATLNKEVAALCAVLGRIREWDVFIAQTLQPMCARMAGHGGLQALLANCEQQRAGCYAELRGESQARELQHLLLSIAIWMTGDYWRKAPLMASARDFATRRLHKLARRLAKSGQDIKNLDAARLHTLRILAKKLRYSAEFFAGWFDKKKTKLFLISLSEVQDVLGQINDIAVAHRMLDELATPAVLAGHQEALTLAKGWIAHDLSHQFSVLHKSLRHFNEQPVFWQH